MDVSEMRAFVRAHLEVDDEELPDALLNVYLRDAYERTLAADNRWPRYEETWLISKVPGTDFVTLPVDCLVPSILSVVLSDKGYRLAQVNHENAEDLFSSLSGVTTGVPVYYSVWKNQMWLWPQVATTEQVDLAMRGYRQPVWSDVASVVPDVDPLLHTALCYYAMSLAYAAQEDEILEGVYIARWDRDVRQQVKMLLQPPMHRPLVLHGGTPIGGVSSYVIIPPTGL